MAYRREQERVLAGSANLNAPGDLLPEGDQQDLKNFAYDSAGNIRSRRGHSLISSIGDPIHSQIKALGNRYQGAADALYKAGVSAATGFDGEPLGLSSYQRWLWVMNRGKQGKYDGSNFRDWAITAPVDEPTGAPGAELATDIATFESGSETWTVDPSGNDSFDSTSFVEGTESLFILAPQDGTWTATANITADLSMVGGADMSDADKFRIYIYANRGRRIDEVTVLIDVGDGSFTTDFYRAVIPHRFFKHAKKEFSPYYIRRTKPSVDDGLPFFERIGSTSGTDWSTVVAVRIILDTRAKVKVKFDKFQVYGGTDSQIEGDDVQYYVTWANNDGHESNPSPVSAKQIVDLQNVVVTQPATSPTDAQVTKWNVYRSGGGLDGVYRANFTPIPIGTGSFNDTKSNEQLTAFAIQMAVDNDAPPAARVLAGPYLGYLLVASSADHKARLWWSKRNKPYAFPGAATDEGQWVDIGDTGEEIVAMTVRPRMVIIYKENSIHRLIGDPDDTTGDTEVTNEQLGVIGANGVVKAGQFDYFHAKDGIYVCANGETAQKVSEKLDPIFKGRTTTLASGVTIPPIDAGNRDKACLGFRNERLYFSYPESGQSEPNVTVVLDVASARWVRDSRGFRSIYNEGESGELLGGLSSGDLVALEDGADDDGAGIPLAFHSRLLNQRLPDTDKTYEDVTVEANTGNMALTVTAYIDNGATAIALGTLQTTTRERVVFSLNNALGRVSRNIAIRVSGTATAEVVIHAIVVNWYVEARQAKSFDTDEQSLGTTKLKEVREVKVDLDNPAAVTLKVYSDHPGEAMALRDTETIALGTTRRMAHVMLDDDVPGFLQRIVMSGTNFRVYGLWALVKVIGTYLLGGKGEFYSSDVIDFDSERIKLIKEIEVVYKSSGTATMKVFADLPDEELAERISKTLPATTEEEAAKVRVPGDLWGRLFIFTITPGTDFQLEAIRVRLKTIGEPNASGWVWVALPVEQTRDAVWMEIPLPVDEAA